MDATKTALPDNSFDVVIFDITISDTQEVTMLQYLFRPIAKKLGAVHLEACPSYIITYDARLNLFALLDKTCIAVDKAKTSDPFHTVTLLQCSNKKII
jgi:hypothetical protein